MQYITLRVLNKAGAHLAYAKLAAYLINRYFGNVNQMRNLKNIVGKFQFLRVEGSDVAISERSASPLLTVSCGLRTSTQHVLGFLIHYSSPLTFPYSPKRVIHHFNTASRRGHEGITFCCPCGEKFLIDWVVTVCWGSSGQRHLGPPKGFCIRIELRFSNYRNWRGKSSRVMTSLLDERPVTVEIKNLKFTYPGIDGHPPPGAKPLIEDFSLTLRAGDRCLLVGANGAGKTTLLKILGGKHMVDPDMVRVLGRSAFHDTALTSSGNLAYLGGEWRRDVAFAGFDVPLQMDIPAQKMIFGVQGVDPKRRDKLIQVLDIDLSWRMHIVSDGQRRRVQICMGLLRPYKVLLLDEITVDLDVLARADLLTFLRDECEQHGCTVIYATHIFDGLESWPTHLAYVADGRLQLAKPVGDIPELKELSLMRTIEKWLRKEIEAQRRMRKERRARGLPEYDTHVEGSRVAGGDPAKASQLLNNGWAAGRLHSTLAGREKEQLYDLSSNRVLR
ncbi:hypothetical protein R1flu_003856 [Riccia fluitans]|uniref:ABC transporter domain-containing protein n=1 Tax=Riccia fluitans TaxID=41844 RepID=A0ABD1YA86_9MARC